jgi:hypothetical protein
MELPIGASTHEPRSFAAPRMTIWLKFAQCADQKTIVILSAAKDLGG